MIEEIVDYPRLKLRFGHERVSPLRIGFVKHCPKLRNDANNATVYIEGSYKTYALDNLLLQLHETRIPVDVSLRAFRQRSNFRNLVHFLDA